MPQDELSTPEPISEEEAQEQQEPEQGGKWQWVGDNRRPEAQKVSDGISDLFEIDDDPDTDDLVSVDIEKDIIDGDLSDLTEVSEDDILGDELGQSDLDYHPEPPRRRPVLRPSRIPRRYVPPTSAGGIGG